MQTYITLLSFTQKGIENIKNGPSRLDYARKAWKEAGAEITAFYLTLGQYDAVVVSEAPDDATIAKLLLNTGSLGNVRTETLRVFKEEEYRKLITDMS